VTIYPPEDWSDLHGWDRYLRSQAGETPDSADDILSLRFVPLVIREGGRVWIPGCGVDRGPALYAALGCSVTATDISPFAIEWQERLAARPPSRVTRGWRSFTRSNDLVPAPGRFRAIVQDFTVERPEGPFDVVINCRACSQLEPDAQRRAAHSFATSLRPAGHLVVDTLNVPGPGRNLLEDNLLAAGFFIPGRDAERWYRDRLEATGIIYALVLGRPHIPLRDQYPPHEFEARKKQDQATLDSFGAEYQARLDAAVPEARRRLEDGVTRIAHVIYSTG
jgi:SAM-dependent methyltransferase